MKHSTAPQLQSPRQLRKQAARSAQAATAAIRLYYGSLEDNDILEVPVAGTRWRLRSDALHYDPKTESLIRHNGETLVRDRMGVLEFNRKASMAPNADRDRVVRSAVKMASKILETRQERGVVQLTGNETEDAELRRRATANWVQWRLHSARRTYMAYKKEQRAALAAGVGSEPMDERTMLAQRFLEDYQSGRYDAFSARTSKFKFRCQETECGRVETDAERFQLHLKQAHKLTDADIAKRYVEDEDEDVPENAPEKKPTARTGRAGKR